MRFAITRKHNTEGTIEPVRIFNAATMEAAADELCLTPDRLQECIGVNDVPYKRGLANGGAWLYHVTLLDADPPAAA